MQINNATGKILADQDFRIFKHNPINEGFVLRDDFLGSGAAGQSGWAITTVNGGTGSGVIQDTAFVNATSRAIGIIRIRTSQNAVGSTAIQLGTANILFGYARVSFLCRVAVNPLDSAGEVVRAQWGLTDNTSNGEATDGVYFEYAVANGSANIFCITASNNTRTKIDSGVPAVANQMNKYGFVVDETASNARFFIDDVLVANITTNIPVGGGRQTGPVFKVGKTSGATNRDLYVDYMELGFEFAKGVR